jgi:hypothetical protein
MINVAVRISKRVNEPKKTGAHRARARMRGQNPLVLNVYSLLSKEIDQELVKIVRPPKF